MRRRSANLSHQATTSTLVVLGPTVGAWATTMSHEKRGHEMVATRTLRSRVQASTPAGSIVRGGLARACDR
eukprot:13733728-Alexandrium_andersonii.AAC.1